MNRHLGRLDFNAPVILGMTAISFVMLLLHAAFGDVIYRMFAAYHTSFFDVWMYARLFTYGLLHQNLSHFAANILMALAIGPLVEEKYGGERLLFMMIITTLVTGLIHVIFSRRAMLMGASGIVFMLILLGSFANIRERRLPLTVLLVGALYLGNEIVKGLTSNDSVSHMGHIIGGLFGAGFGFYFHKQ